MHATPRTLVHLLQQHAAAFPERVLYTYLAEGESESGSLTYAQLDEAAQGVARTLLEVARPGDRAVLLYPVGLEYLVGFFGCLYAGVVAVPAYPLRTESRSGGRIRTIIDDCKPPLVLTCARQRAGVEGALGELGYSALQVVATDESRRAGTMDGAARIGPDTLAFLQYTSASIAEAKGVRVTHANLMANQEMIRHAMAHDGASHFVSWLPPYHDMGLVGNLLHPLYLGTSCVFMPPAAFVQQPARWLSAISRYRARTSGAPNFAYDLCVRKVTPEQLAALDLSSWTVAYCGAESIDARVAERFCARFAPCGFRREAFYPCYGLAEATLMASGSQPGRAPVVVDADPDSLERGVLRECARDHGRTLVSCGAAPPGARLAIVDPRTQRPLPDGEVGEICVQGAHVADGYWNRPDISRQVFEARLEGRPGTYLRTGDLGTILRGHLFVVGRIKEVIIHRGRNISPVDVESVVEAAAGRLIDSCAAFAIPGDDTEEVGIVMEVARHGFAAESAQDAAESIAWDVYRAFDVLPGRLVWATKGAIPRTSSGKKQRLLCARLLALGKLDIVAEWHSGTAYQPPGIDSHEGGNSWLPRLISRFTGIPVDQVLRGVGGASAWGLDSLRAVEIAHHIERRTGVALPLSLFYEATSLAEMLGEIERRRDRGDVVPDLNRDAAIEPASRQMDVTAGQEAIWFSQHVNPTSPAFHLKWAVRFLAPIDPDRLRRAVQAVLAHHDALRCVFHLQPDGRLTADVLPPGTVDYEYSTDDADAALVDWVDRECDRPFDLQRDVLVRIRHGRGPSGDIVSFSLHHLIADLWSCALFTEEVIEHYATGALLQRARSYRVYVQHARAAAADRDRYLPYWRRQLTDAPLLDPVDVLVGARSRAAIRHFAGAAVSSGLDAAESQQLLERARELRVSRQMLLLAIYGVWWWRQTGLEDFLGGCLASGRRRAVFSRMQGLLTNPFAVRFRINAETFFADLVSSVRDQVLEAIEREDFPFQSVVSGLRFPRELGRSPLFQNMFVYQQLPETSVLAPCVLGGEDAASIVCRGLTMQCVRLPVRAARCDFTLYCMQVGERLRWEAVFDTELFEPARVRELMVRFDLLARRVVEGLSDVRLRDLASEAHPVV